MPAEPALKIVPGIRSPCFDVDLLREVFSKGDFADPDDPLKVLDHFTRPCRRCWRRLETLAADDSVDVDLGFLSRNAAQRYRRLPVALVLGRLVAFLRGTGAEASLPPTNRYLLRKVRSGTKFDFWWLLIEEVRLLAMGSPDRHVERWQYLSDTLAEHSCGSPDLDRELGLLIRTYEGDELRVAGKPKAAQRCLDEVLDEDPHCRPAIRATFFELRSDLDRSLRRPRQALRRLGVAEPLLQDVGIPGRLAETRTRIALARLLLDDLEPALSTFREALELIPEGTDPRLRLDILLHMAAVTVRQHDSPAARHYLTEAEPFFPLHASDLMWAQRHWLWGLVHMDSGEDLAAEENLFKALEGFQEFDSPLARAQVLVNLSQVYLQGKKEAELDWVLKELVSTLKQPEVRLHVLDELENVLREARERGLEIPDLSELEERREWVH